MKVKKKIRKPSIFVVALVYFGGVIEDQEESGEPTPCRLKFHGTGRAFSITRDEDGNVVCWLGNLGWLDDAAIGIYRRELEEFEEALHHFDLLKPHQGVIMQYEVWRSASKGGTK